MVMRYRVGRWLSHTRFVPTPLYRLILIAAVISGVLQLVYGAPASVSDTAKSHWFDWAFVGIQMLGALMAFIGLYLVEGESPPPWRIHRDVAPVIDPTKLHRSLMLELVGLIFLQTVMAIQIVSLTYYQHHVPSSLVNWMLIVFWLWSFFRDRDILRAQRKLTR